MMTIVAGLSIKNHEPSAGRVLPDLILSATGIYSLAGPPAAAAPPRTPGALLLSHCTQTPVNTLCFNHMLINHGILMTIISF